MGKPYKRGDSEYWYVDVYVDGRRVKKSTHCTDYRAAEAKGKEFEREAALGNSLETKRATLGEVLKSLVDDRLEAANAGKGSKETAGFYEKKAEVLCRVMGKDSKVYALQAGDVDGFISTRRDAGVSEHTIRKELGTLQAALKLAKRRGMWVGDIGAILPVGFRTEYKPRERSLSHKELDKLLGSMPAGRAAMVAFAVATGARRSELFRAERCDVQTVGKQTLVKLRGEKTELAERTVPIVTGWQRKLLKRALADAPGGEAGPLFERWENLNRDVKAACDKAEIDPCSPNDWRRSTITLLRVDGAELDTLAAVAGHVTTTMVQRVYGKLSPQQLAVRLREQTRKRAS